MIIHSKSLIQNVLSVMRSFVKPTLYSVPSFGPKVTGFTLPYRNVKCLTDNEGQIQGTFPNFPTALTLRELFDQIVDYYYSYPMYGSLIENKTIEWYTYGEFGELVRALSAGFLKYGVKMGDLIGVLVENSTYFALAQWASAYMGGVIIPIDISYENDVVQQILTVFKCSSLICTSQTYPTIFQIYMANPTGKLSKIFLLCDENEKNHLQDDMGSPLDTQLGIPLFTLPQIIQEKPQNDNIQYPTILATSLCVLNVGAGRCGSLNPCCLTHSNLIAAAAGVPSCDYQFGRDVYLPTMPMSRVFERSIQLCILAYGGCISFVSSPLLEALEITKPTVISFSGDNIQDLAEALIADAMGSSFFRRIIYDFAFSVAAQAKEGRSELPWLIRTIIIDPFRAKVGGRLKLIISACSYLEPRVQHVLRTMLQIPVVQLYGVTEAGGIICIQKVDDDYVGNVGAPTACCEIRVRDFVPAHQRVADDEPGEILVRGPNLFSGYHRNKEMTKKALLEDGWFATGDIGRILPNGTLVIVDTIKDWSRRKKKPS